MPTPPARRTAGRVSCSTKSPIGPKTRTSSPGWRAAKARLYGESDRRTAYSRYGRVGLDARDMGRASIPSLVFSCRKVNWVGRERRVPSFLCPGVGSVIPLFEGVVREWQSFFALLTTVITILVMWLNQHNMFGHIARVDRRLMLGNGVRVLFVVLTPFGTAS